jgi:tetratricopeptide (TPR) repeat protein
LSDELHRHVLNALDAGHLALAAEVGKRGLVQRPDDHRLLIAYAMTLQDLARYGEAQEALERALRLAPPSEHALILRQLGALAEARSDPNVAQEWYSRAIAAAPRDATSYIYLGAMLAKAGLLEEAEAVHRNATNCIAGCLDEAYLNLGLVLRAQGRYLEALDAFREAAARDPLDHATQAALEDMDQVLFRFPEA